MKKYIWSWADEDGCSIHTADSLKDIAETYINSHYYDSDFVVINVDGGLIKIEITYCDLKTCYEVEQTEEALWKFLEELATDMRTKESFSIRKTSSLMDT